MAKMVTELIYNKTVVLSDFYKLVPSSEIVFNIVIKILNLIYFTTCESSK